MKIQVSVLADNADLRKRMAMLEDESFPKYLNEEPIWLKVQEDIFANFSAYHLFLIDAETNDTVGVSINVPLCWNGLPEDLPTYNGLLTRCLDEHQAGRKPTALCAILGAVSPSYRSKGVFKRVFAETTELLKKHDIRHFLSPVRPSNKQLYPNFDIADFLSWRSPDGQLIDPWLNSFEQQGAKFLGIARDAITVNAPVEQWTKWTGMQFPVSGDFVIPGGHRMLKVDRASGVARYAEDHVWYSILSRNP
jgi:hypothetical protein